MFCESKFIKLRGYLWRNKGVKQKRGIVRALHQEGGKVGGGFIDLKYNADYHTGCWVYNGGQHEITIGGQFKSALTRNAQKNEAHVNAAYRALGRHEAWHGRATDQVEAIVTALNEEHIPFQIFNIFEDARIEHLARTDTSGFDEGGKFGWDNWVRFPTRLTKPIEWLQWLIHREASSFKTITSAEAGADWIGPKKTQCTTAYRAVRKGNKGREVCTRKAVRTYYQQIIEARSTLDLLPIIKDWCELFGLDHPKGTPRVSDEINGKKADGTKGDSSKEGGAGYSEESGETGGLTSRRLDPNKVDGKLTRTETRQLEGFVRRRGSRYESRYHNNPDLGKVRRIVNRLTQITKSGAIDRDQLGSVGARLHLPEVIAGSDRFARRVTEVTGKRTITVLCDFSGSMYETWRQAGGLEFVLALRELHIKGILDVRLWFSGGHRCFRVPLHRIPVEELLRVNPIHGCESFATTLREPQCQRDLAESTLLIGWTDGMISDGDVDYRKLKRDGTDVIGCAPRHEQDNDIRANIIYHFGKGYVGEAEALARHIAHYVLSRTQ
mgnify:CR=1 FL=1|tara:strand:+ start:342 stop:2000 length:1659 start_codon:yes stop_codon:yes gene_type:complete